MNKKEIAIQMAKNLNNKLEASILNVPILEGFNLIKNTVADNIIFAAITEHKYLEQLIVDTYIEDVDTLDSKVEEAIRQAEDFAKQNKLKNHSFIFLKDYKGAFDFKLYVQDYMIDNSHGIRQINAYFLEPHYNKFYQITLSTGPIPLPSDVYKPGIIDLDNDSISKQLLEMIELILSKVRYA